jgi:uncharacterized delta-60 repeat protein
VRGRLSASCIIVVAALAMAIAPVASAAPGLDPTFGEGGLSSSPPGTAGGGSSIEVDSAPDGSATVSSGGHVIVHFGPDGAWDSTFAGAGDLSLAGNQYSPEPGEIEPWSTAVDSKGRLLVFGAELDGKSAPSGSTEGGSLIGSEAVVLRFGPEGNPDPTFGAGTGQVHYTFGVKSTYHATAFPMLSAIAGTVDSQDRPVLAVGALEPVGGCYAKGGPGVQTRAVARLTEAGLPDPTFGRAGVAPATGTTTFPYLGLTTGDLPIIDVGTTGGREPECHRGSTVIRLDANGVRLGSYGDHGVVHVRAFSVAIAEPSGGTILTRSSPHLLELRRRGPNGGKDRSFGRDGLEKLPLPGARGASVGPVAVDSQGRILMAGSIGVQNERGKNKGRSAIVVGRLLPNGRPDPSFGEGGWIFTRLAAGVALEGAGATLDPSGRLLVGGVIRAPGETLAGYILARYLLES